MEVEYWIMQIIEIIVDRHTVDRIWSPHFSGPTGS